MPGYRSGTDLIMGAVESGTFKPFGYSSNCEINDSTETGERVTKEAPDSHWKEKYVKSLSEQIIADGFVYDGVSATSMGFPDLKTLWLNKSKVKLRYRYRDQASGEGLYEGDFIITSLKQTGKAGDDEQWSVTFDNCGPVTAATTLGAGGAKSVQSK